MTRHGIWIVPILVAMSNLWAPQAAAAPVDFPDLAGYTQVNAAEYSQHAIGSQYGVETPDGLQCEISSLHYKPLSFSCVGALPGVPEGVTQVTAATLPAEDFAQESKTPLVQFRPPYKFGTYPESGTRLPPMHYITALNVTCAVDGAGMTACRYRSDDGGRQYGFVLSPNGSAIL